LVKTALVVKGDKGKNLFRLLKQCDEIDLVGLACPDGEIDWLTDMERKNYYITADLDKITALPELETVIDGTEEPAVADYLRGKTCVTGFNLKSWPLLQR